MERAAGPRAPEPAVRIGTAALRRLRKDVEYTVNKRDESGYSKGYDVVGPDGREWDIKVGKEVQSEIVVSRILWALGYHQPATYYVTGWKLAGTWEDEGEPARFRLRVRS